MSETNDQNGTSLPTGACGSSKCICGGKGPAVTAVLEMLAPSEAATSHFTNAGVEFLKGVRELLDEWIQSLPQKHNKGTKLDVQ